MTEIYITGYPHPQYINLYNYITGEYSDNIFPKGFDKGSSAIEKYYAKHQYNLHITFDLKKDNSMYKPLVKYED